MKRLRVPGPTPVPERVRSALSTQMVYHRGDEFSELLTDATRLLKPLLGTQQTPLLCTSSGTGGLEAALANILEPGNRVVALDNGHWGARFGRLAATLGAHVETVASPWGSAADVVALQEVLARPASKSIRAVLVAHNDSFTGAVSDLAAIGSVVRDHSALLVVDAVSSLGTMPIEADNWNLDVVISASQKGLMCPPGLAIINVSNKAWERIENHSIPSDYWDLRRAYEMAIKGQTAFTPAVNLVAALREALTIIHERGVIETFERHRLLSEALHGGVNALGLELFPQKDAASPSVSVICLPDTVPGADLVDYFYSQYDTIIAGARRSKLNGRVIRLGTMGYCDPDDIRLDLWQLAHSLCAFGYRCDVERASEACERILREGVG